LFLQHTIWLVEVEVLAVIFLSQHQVLVVTEAVATVVAHQLDMLALLEQQIQEAEVALVAI
jgi:hypothetical protein